MTKTNPLLPLLLLLALGPWLTGCGGDKPTDGGSDAAHEDDDHGHAHDDGDDHAAKRGGVLVESSDHSAHFEFVQDQAAGTLEVWFYDGEMAAAVGDDPALNLVLDDGTRSVKGTTLGKGAGCRFEDEALKGHVHGRLRVKIGGRTYTPELPEDDHAHGQDDHGHGHDDGHDHGHEGEGPHHGMVHPFFGEDGTEAGHVEIKLHADKGDLELWIAADEGMTQPVDLPLDAKVTVTFLSPRKEAVVLQVRNKDRNEDEDDVANVRDGKTNYFIFPGDTGADASWLQGEDFEGKVQVSFTRGGTLKTRAFTLTPHHH